MLSLRAKAHMRYSHLERRKRLLTKSIAPRKSPQQTRAESTVAVIVEAAARILERRGFEGFNTNAVAAKAGVSIGSLYQYFPNKDALLSALIAREAAPLLQVEKELFGITGCRAAFQSYIKAGIRYQMRRPQLARLIDTAEKADTFSNQVMGTMTRLRTVVEKILELEDAPEIVDKAVAAADVVAITRSLIDAAGERGDNDSDRLRCRVEGAIWGYLTSAEPSAKPAARSLKPMGNM